MRKYYFYCPNCGYEYISNVLPDRTVGNTRDGYGRPIHHYECEKCHNLDAGFMLFQEETLNEKKYLQYVIGMYQNIRGIRKI